ncbi:MAG: zinc ribbon domain-containing protein [Chloroflexota bacterium]
MPISSILLGLALVILVVPFVIDPFIKNNRRKRASQKNTSGQLSKHETLMALRDLDFDFQTGKITPEDYAPLRQQLLIAAAQAEQVVETPKAAVKPEVESKTCPECNAAIQMDDKFCPKCGTALNLTCPQCQKKIAAGDKFCAHCGAALKVEMIPA